MKATNSDSKKAIGLLKQAIAEIERSDRIRNDVISARPCGSASEKPGVDSTNGWFYELTEDQKSKVKSIIRSGMLQLASETVRHVQTLRADCGRPDYLNMLDETRDKMGKTKNLEKRAMIRTEISAQHRLLSQKAQAAYRFFSHLTGVKNPIPKDSFGSHIGF
jgi:hypothetical protein